MSKRQKVSIIGAGNVGATLAQRLFEKGYADVVLVDVIPGMPQGKALDMLQSAPLVGADASIVGSNGYEETAGSDLVIVTAGVPRKPGMSRDDLLLTNAAIIEDVVRQVVTFSPNAVLLVVTNPLDAMVYTALRVSGFPRQRVFGMAGVLDTARFRAFVAQELNVSPRDVHALVLGCHGDAMVPVLSRTTVGGVPLRQLLHEEKIARLVRRTRDGGAEIVGLLKTESAYYAPSAAISEMAEAVLLDRKRVLPASVWLDGEYSLRDVCLGVPVKLGAGGVEDVLEMELAPEERTALAESAESVRKLIETLERRPARTEGA